MAQIDAKPDYLGPNVKKRFMGGLEGYDFVGDDCQFQQSGLQQHARKSVAPSAMDKLGQRYGTGKYATGKYGTNKYGTGNGLKVGSGPSGEPPPPPPPPPPPAPPGGAAVELQQHEGGHQAEYQTSPQSETAPATTTADPVKKSSAPAKSGGQKRHLDAFGFARYAASVHVVCGHLYNKHPQPVEDWYTSDWGFTWVPWFMMLSGFILTYARLGSSRPDKLDPVWTFTIQRARSVYPLYLSSLFCAAALDAYIKSAAFTLGNWRETLLSLLMLHAWDPYVTEHTYQSHCWFLSCILPYWMLHNYMYKALKAASNQVLWGIAAFVSLWPWVFLMIIPAAMGDVNWYREHDWGKTDTGTDILVVMLKFHPIFYLPVYVFGMVIAVLFVRKGDDLNWVVRHGAALGYFGLFLVFVATPWMGTPPYEGIPASKLTCRLGVLAPLQGLSLVGLAVGTDPVARLFSWLPLQIGERLSFPQYVFQFIVFTIWSQYTGLGYWSLLICFSLAGAILIQEPLARPTKDRKRKLFAFVWMCLFPLICVLLLIISGNEIFTPPPGHLPDFVSYNAEAYDTKLTLMSKPYQLLDGKYGEGQYAYINPSFLTTTRQELQNFTYGNVTNQSLVTVQDLWVTARRFRLDIVTVEGSVEATENGMPIFRAPACTWFDPLQLCQDLEVTPADNEADCEAICCGLANCRLYQWMNAANNTVPASCGLMTKNKEPNCTTGVVPSNLGKSGVKTAPLFPFNATASTNATAFWHTINATATVTSTWHSDIVFGTLDQDTMKASCPLEAIAIMSNVGGADGVWYPCTPYAIYAEANGTMFQLITTGPEDARLFPGPNGGFFMSFTSNIPQTMPVFNSTTNTSSLPINCPGGSSTQFFTTPFPYFIRDTCPAPPQPVNGTAVPPRTPKPISIGPALKYSLGTDLRVAQKNWIALPYASTTLFITNLNPVEIVSVDGNGDTTLQSTYRNVRLANTAIKLGVVFHGGSNAILVESRPIPASAITWNTNANTNASTSAPTSAPTPNQPKSDPCDTPFTTGSYAQSLAPTPAKCVLTSNSLACTNGWIGTAYVSGNQITFPTLFNQTNLVGYWMKDASGNCEINFGQNQHWSYQPEPPAPKPPTPPPARTPQELAAEKYYYLTRPDFYLAAFHSVDGAGRYRNYLAEFETSPPFQILRISVALPLLEYPVAQPGFNHGVQQKMAFLSTIAELQNGNFAFGYGTSNYQARALVLSRAQYETMFTDPIPK